MSRRRKRERILVTEPAEMAGEEIELNFEPPPGTFWGSYNEMEAKGGLSEFGKFMHLSEQGRNPAMLAMNFVLAENMFSALEVICQGNNWQSIASTLSFIFFGAAYGAREFDLRVMKAKGYDLLRGLVRGCANVIREDDLRFPEGYDRLVNRLFASQGLQAP